MHVRVSQQNAYGKFSKSKLSHVSHEGIYPLIDAFLRYFDNFPNSIWSYTKYGSELMLALLASCYILAPVQCLERYYTAAARSVMSIVHA